MGAMRSPAERQDLRRHMAAQMSQMMEHMAEMQRLLAGADRCRVAPSRIR